MIADLPNIDPMYQYSLEYFKKLFNYCLDISEKSKELELRLEIISNFVTKFMYTNVCRGLFSRHKLILENVCPQNLSTRETCFCD